MEGHSRTIDNLNILEILPRHHSLPVAVILVNLDLETVATTSYTCQTQKQNNKHTPWPLARKRTLPTERQPLVGEI
jgi:hypothetical protein